jgi:hypothetical protein
MVLHGLCVNSSRNNAVAHRVDLRLESFLSKERINIMHHVLLTVAAGVTVLATGGFMPGRAEALPLSASFGANLAVEALAPVVPRPVLWTQV